MKIIITNQDYAMAERYGIKKEILEKQVYKHKAQPSQIFKGKRTGKKLTYLRVNSVKVDGNVYAVTMNKTNQCEPHSARIRVSESYFDETGGEKGWEPNCIYDKIFDDWEYAHLLYKEMILKNER